MRPTLIQVDDFAADALAVRATVIANGFSTRKGPDGFDYDGISNCAAPQWHGLLEHLLSRKVDVKLAFFRMTVAGEMPKAWIHTDGLIARHAGLLYLNPPEQCQGGTAFWRHTALKIDEMPSVEALQHVNQDPEWFSGMVNRECRELGSWEQSGFVSMRFNRFISYPTQAFHSRYPFAGFGTTPADARLTWAVFYD